MAQLKRFPLKSGADHSWLRGQPWPVGRGGGSYEAGQRGLALSAGHPPMQGGTARWKGLVSWMGRGGWYPPLARSRIHSRRLVLLERPPSESHRGRRCLLPTLAAETPHDNIIRGVTRPQCKRPDRGRIGLGRATSSDRRQKALGRRSPVGSGGVPSWESGGNWVVKNQE